MHDGPFKSGPGLPSLHAYGESKRVPTPKKETTHEVHARACPVGDALSGHSDGGEGHSDDLSGHARPSRKRRTATRNMRSVVGRSIGIAGAADHQDRGR